MSHQPLTVADGQNLIVSVAGRPLAGLMGNSIKMDLTANTFSLPNAQVLALYARMAYEQTPDVYDEFYDTRILVRDLGDCLIVSCCGTRGLRNLITDAEAWRSPVTCGEVHHGFWNAWLPVKFKLIQKIEAILAGAKKPVFVCGHSLGGALAMIAAKYLALKLYDICGVYTFGCPRVGDKTFARNYNACHVAATTLTLLDLTFTVINDCDIVPRIPGWLAGYRRPGHDEFMGLITPGIAEDPSVPFRLASDVRHAFNAWRARRGWLALEDLLDDHHIDKYIAALASFS